MSGRSEKFFSKSDLLGKENHYSIFKRTPTDEFSGGYHYHDFFEATYYHSLTDTPSIGSFIIRDKSYPIRDGAVVIVNAFDPHEVHMNPGVQYTRYAMNFDLDFLLSASSKETKIFGIFSTDSPKYPVLDLSDEQQQVVKKIFHSMEDCRLYHGRDLYNKAMLYEMLAVLFDIFYYESSMSRKDEDHLEMVASIVKFVEANIGEPLSLNRVADHVNYSPSYTSRMFHYYTGETLNRYILSKRVDKAKLFLTSSNKSIMQISKEVGFENYNHFFRVFKTIVGMGPSEYQKAYKEKVIEPNQF